MYDSGSHGTNGYAVKALDENGNVIIYGAQAESALTTTSDRITLPQDLQYEYYKEMKKMETETQERFVSIYEIMGKKEGLAEGLEKGLAEGQASMLIEQLTYKFGNIADNIVDDIKSASLEQIKAWSLNLLNAQTIDEVFKS